MKGHRELDFPGLTAEARNGTGEPPLETHKLKLRPFKGNETWTVTLDPSIVRVQNADSHEVLMVPREDIAQYMHFERDLIRGRTVTFAAAYGMKPYKFRCTREEFATLLSCMPQKSPEEIRKSVRLSGLAIALAGIVYLVLPNPFYWWWGLVLAGLGAGALAHPSRKWYLFNAVGMFAVGLSGLFVQRVVVVNPAHIVGTLDILVQVAGIVFVCWGVQQLAMLSANAQIRAARVMHDPEAAAMPARKSPLVRRVAVGALVAAVLLWGYALALVYLALSGTTMVTPTRSLAGISLGMIDIVACTVLGTVCLGSGIVLLMRKRPAYAEARIVTTVLMALALVFWWGAVFSFDPSQPMLLFGTLLSNGVQVFGRPYVWGSLLVGVVVVNWLFVRAVDKELAQGLD
jgi:hypothetical protein